MSKRAPGHCPVPGAAKAAQEPGSHAGQRPVTEAGCHFTAEDGPRAHDSLSVQAALRGVNSGLDGATGASH